MASQGHWRVLRAAVRSVRLRARPFAPGLNPWLSVHGSLLRTPCSFTASPVRPDSIPQIAAVRAGVAAAAMCPHFWRRGLRLGDTSGLPTQGGLRPGGSQTERGRSTRTPHARVWLMAAAGFSGLQKPPRVPPPRVGGMDLRCPPLRSE